MRHRRSGAPAAQQNRSPLNQAATLHDARMLFTEASPTDGGIRIAQTHMRLALILVCPMRIVRPFFLGVGKLATVDGKYFWRSPTSWRGPYNCGYGPLARPKVQIRLDCSSSRPDLWKSADVRYFRLSESFPSPSRNIEIGGGRRAPRPAGKG